MSDSFVTPWVVANQAPLVHRIWQARILEWVAISFCRGSSDPGVKPESPALAGGFFTAEPPGKAHLGKSSLTEFYITCLLTFLSHHVMFTFPI